MVTVSYRSSHFALVIAILLMFLAVSVWLVFDAFFDGYTLKAVYEINLFEGILGSVFTSYFIFGFWSFLYHLGYKKRPYFIFEGKGLQLFGHRHSSLICWDEVQSVAVIQRYRVPKTFWLLPPLFKYSALVFTFNGPQKWKFFPFYSIRSETPISGFDVSKEELIKIIEKFKKVEVMD